MTHKIGINPTEIVRLLEKDGCTVLKSSNAKICKYDYQWNDQAVEAISFQPLSDGPFPALVLIPGYQRTARDFIPLGATFAREGFASVAITQLSFGKSPGQPDYVGLNTITALIAGFKKFKNERYVDAKRMGIYGYSRGAMAASLLAVQLDDVRAAVFVAGIYDFRKAYDETKFEGIRKNMELETGMTQRAIEQRSSILQMNNLKCPVLILHGEKDENVPVSQALLLRERLTTLNKEFEIKIFPDRDHSLKGKEFVANVLEFFKRKLMVYRSRK